MGPGPGQALLLGSSPTKTSERAPPSTLVQLCSAQPYSSRTSQEVAPIPHSS